MLDIVIYRCSGISIRLCSIWYIMLSLTFSSCLESAQNKKKNLDLA